MAMKREFKVWSRSVKRYDGREPDHHELHLLIVPDGTYWAHAPQALHIAVAPDFEAEPGDTIEISIERRG